MDENKETISADDMQILREAVAQLAAAQNNKTFVEGFLSRKYELQNGDSIDIATARISRTVSVTKQETAGGAE